MKKVQVKEVAILKYTQSIDAHSIDARYTDQFYKLQNRE